MEEEEKKISQPSKKKNKKKKNKNKFVDLEEDQKIKDIKAVEALEVEQAKV